MAADSIVVAGMARTPMGGFQGALAAVDAPTLGAAAISAALERAGVDGAEVGETIMGCVLQAGQGQAPARQAARAAGIPDSVGATTVNKMCGSGMRAAMFGHDAIAAGATDIVIAGGLESMTNAPYLLPRARGGLRMGHGEVKDHMFLDGLEDAYDRGKLMGDFAENTAEKYQFSREEQDEFAIRSLERGRRANEDGSFAEETVPVTVRTRKGETTVTRDEQPFTADIARIPRLRPAFREGGTVTAANSSSISDGASALALMRRSEAERRGAEPLAEIVAHAAHAQAPEWFTTAPVGAIDKVLARAGWSKDEVDLWEINEAFAVVAMAAMKEHGLPADKVNVHGGACAMGHPIGSSGSRIVATLIAALRKYDLRKGVAALCIGGGEATAIAVERPA